MMWKTHRPGTKLRAQHRWHVWFAWHPVCVTKTQKVWMEKVMRKSTQDCSWGSITWDHEYMSMSTWIGLKRMAHNESLGKRSRPKVYGDPALAIALATQLEDSP